jgi:excisionase family DNA binding protein
MSGSNDREILTIEQAAELLGVSVKTFNKVLHSQAIPARKIGREWKFSRQALIDWVGSGTSTDFYREATITPGNGSRRSKVSSGRRTSGWRIELD